MLILFVVATEIKVLDGLWRPTLFVNYNCVYATKIDNMDLIRGGRRCTGVHCLALILICVASIRLKNSLQICNS